ncbi:MAG TPA: hypothetical protein VEC57_19160 [Candidatus Limnocylindrales bacterium]|nr:hypothetical protein [Candidatus Limnocylindrales bacterium]
MACFPSDDRARASVFRACAFYFALTLAACVGAGVFSRPVVADNRLYFFMAERAASGTPPHVSMIDTKSQLATLLGGAAIAIGRSAGVDDVHAGRAASVVAASAAVAGTALLAASVAGSSVAGAIAALALLSTRGFVDHAAIGFNPKIFLAAFLVWAHWVCARNRPGAAGFLAGCAFLCWQPGLLGIAAVAAETLLRHGVRRCATVIMAALLPIALYQAYFLANDAVGEQLVQTYVMTLGSVHTRVAWAPSLLFLLTEARGHLPLRLAPLLCTVTIAASALIAITRPRRALAMLQRQGAAISLLVAGAGAVLFTLYDHQGVPDLFFPAPYVAIGAGIAIAAAARSAAVVGERAAAAVTVIAVAALMVQLHGGGVQLPRSGRTLAEQRELAAVLADLGEQHGGVWAYEAVHLLALAHLENWVPVAQLYDDVASVMDIHAYRPQRDGRMPGIIVRGRGRLPGFDGYAAVYERIANPAFGRDGLRLYRKLVTAEPEPPID